MPINVTTKYTKERIIRYQHNHALSRKFLLIFITAATLMILLFNIMFDFEDIVIRYSLFLMIVIDLSLAFMLFVMPYILIGQNKAVGYDCNYVFGDEKYTVSIATSEMSENITSKYSTLVKVLKKGSELYLFIAPNQAYVVDLSSLSDEDIARLKGTLNKYVDPIKFKWK